MSVLAFDVLRDVHPQSAFVGAGCEIHCGDDLIAGRVFLAHRAGEVAACVQIGDGQYIANSSVYDLARRGNLAAHAELTEHHGCFVVSRVWLTRKSGHAWPVGLSRDLIGSAARDWWASVTLASMAAGTRDALPVVFASRPHGDGEPTIINLHGEIGHNGRTADCVEAALWRPEHAQTVVVNVDSIGGSLDESIKIYRLLAGWPCAVFCNIERQASSGAALIALAADVRTIRADGTMLLHQPNITFQDGEPHQVTDLLRLANKMLESTREIINLVAVSTGNTVEDAEQWCINETVFDAGTALRCGLIHAIEADAVPDKPRALRAKFKPIHGPYRVAARAQ